MQNNNNKSQRPRRNRNSSHRRAPAPAATGKVTETASGILKLNPKGFGILRDPSKSFRPGPTDATVHPSLIKKYGLVSGAAITGGACKGNRGLELATVETVCGLPPEEFSKRRPYTELVALDPEERFGLAATGDITMRVIDMVAPVGKGTRGLIVSPPKAGKTVILEKLADAIHAHDPDTRIIVLLVDERPEEVTWFRRSVQYADVLASSSDQSVEQQLELVELAQAHMRTELECGNDVAVLVDSLTRMGRAYNLKSSNTGRTMSGGLGAGAMEIPRRFFGMARNIEDGGSVTILATALVDTGSRMDTLIFEEFKGTGNSELILDRKLAEERIFPAINIPASGTRKEERLFGKEEGQRINKLRRILSEMQPRDAMEKVLQLMDQYPTNEALLEAVGPGR
jgi:transcription termination factor Rho